MPELPQLHDWFNGLLTGNQWLFAYIIAIFLFGAIAIYVAKGVDEPEFFGGPAILFIALATPLLIWFVITAILNLLSFMIMLLNT